MLQTGRRVDLALEPLRAEARGQLGVEHLEGDEAVVLEVAGEEDGRHPAAPELSLDRVAVAQPFLELRAQVGHSGRSGDGVRS